jgi:hypothetical protein
MSMEALSGIRDCLCDACGAQLDFTSAAAECPAG